MTSQAKTSDANAKHKRSPAKQSPRETGGNHAASSQVEVGRPPEDYATVFPRELRPLYVMELPFPHSGFTPHATMPPSSRSSATTKPWPGPTAARKSSSLTTFRQGSPAAFGACLSRTRSRACRTDSPSPLSSCTTPSRSPRAARVATEDVLYSAPPPSTATPGVTATVALMDHRCCGGFTITDMAEGEGTFKTRCAWASTGGKDEVFQGFFSVDVGYATTRVCSAIDDNDVVESLDVYMPFWGTRACVGLDEREVGLGTTGGDDESMGMRNLRLMLAGAGLKHAL